MIKFQNNAINSGETFYASDYINEQALGSSKTEKKNEMIIKKEIKLEGELLQ